MIQSGMHPSHGRLINLINFIYGTFLPNLGKKKSTLRIKYYACEIRGKIAFLLIAEYAIFELKVVAQTESYIRIWKNLSHNFTKENFYFDMLIC